MQLSNMVEKDLTTKISLKNLIKLFNNSTDENRMKFLFVIANFSLGKAEKNKSFNSDIIKNKLIFDEDEEEEKLFNEISKQHLINLSNNFLNYMAEIMKDEDEIIPILNNLKYVSNIHSLNIANNNLDVKLLDKLLDNFKYLPNLLELNISCMKKFIDS